jgi:hypothetical protein
MLFVAAENVRKSISKSRSTHTTHKEAIMPNKTPYELRFNVLEMARDLEMQQYEVLMNTFWSTHNNLEQAILQLTDQHISYSDIRDVCDNVKEVSDRLLKSIPDMPTSDQINRRAKELYEFVENK